MGSKDKACGKRKQGKKEEDAKPDASQKRGKKEEQPAESEDELEMLDECEDESDSEPGEPTAAELFEEEIKKREEEMGMHCMVLGTLDIPSDEGNSEDDEGEGSDSEDGKQPTMEQLQQLARVWVPTDVDTYFSSLAEELQQIGCTDDEDSDDGDMETLEGEKLTAEQKALAKKAMQEAGYMLRMLTTRHSYPMHQLLSNSLAAVDKALKANNWKEAFCHWAATVQASRRETHWFADTDVPAEVEKIYEKLRTQWTKLEKHSDEELGGLICEGDTKSTKDAFSSFLQGLADELGELDYKVKDAVKKS